MNLLKKDATTGVSIKFYEFFQNTYHLQHLRLATSKIITSDAMLNSN